MKLELLTSSPIGEGPPLPNRLYFCLGCGSHREQFNPEECLYLYLNTAIGKTFVGFYWIESRFMCNGFQALV